MKKKKKKKKKKSSAKLKESIDLKRSNSFVYPSGSILFSEAVMEVGGEKHS